MKHICVLTSSDNLWTDSDRIVLNLIGCVILVLHGSVFLVLHCFDSLLMRFFS
jgi:hypothetical protein